jgi:hypothetical protein
MRGREAGLSLLREYVIGWNEYSEFAGTYGRFRYVLLEVARA